MSRIITPSDRIADIDYAAIESIESRMLGLRSSDVSGTSSAHTHASDNNWHNSSITADDIIADISRLSQLSAGTKTPKFDTIVGHPKTLEALREVCKSGYEVVSRPYRDVMMFNGMTMLSNPEMVLRRQVRFPRSKRRRIRKKWRNNPRNWVTEPDPQVYMMNTRLCPDPDPDPLKALLFVEPDVRQSR